MASLGRLVAGVAHELNNPISFVYGNIHCLDRYRKKLAAYFEEVDGCAGANVADARERHGVDHILDDLAPLIEGTLEGDGIAIDEADRIVQLMRHARHQAPERGHFFGVDQLVLSGLEAVSYTHLDVYKRQNLLIPEYRLESDSRVVIGEA